MKEELDAFEKNSAWLLQPLLQDKKKIGCKWVHKVKYKLDGEVEHYKAWLVAKGYNQVEEIDYHETFALIMKHVTTGSFLQ